jgi:uncharacterized protein
MKPSEALAAHRSELRQLVSRHGLSHPRVFGSVLSGTDTEQSDLDLLVDPAESTSLLTLAAFKIDAETLLGSARIGAHSECAAAEVSQRGLAPGAASMKHPDQNRAEPAQRVSQAAQRLASYRNSGVAQAKVFGCVSYLVASSGICTHFCALRVQK